MLIVARSLFTQMRSHGYGREECLMFVNHFLDLVLASPAAAGPSGERAPTAVRASPMFTGLSEPAPPVSGLVERLPREDHSPPSESVTRQVGESALALHQCVRAT